MSAICRGGTAIAPVEVIFRDGRAEFDCAHGGRLLYEGLAQGIALPYECASGTCGSCKARVLEGDVENEWPAAPGAMALRRSQGEILMCQSRVCGPVRLEVKRRLPAPPSPLPQPFTAQVEEHGLLTHDVTLLRMRLSRPLAFEPGQFCLVEAPGVPGFRAYSMVNAPDGGTLVDFIVKRKPGGLLTEVLFSQVLPSLTFSGFGPLGRATFAADSDRHLLVMAGGTGIAGPLSILEAASESGHLDRFDAAVYFGLRAHRDLFFLDRLSTLAALHPERLKVVVAISEEAVPEREARLHPRLTFAQGMLHEVAFAQPPANTGDATAFLAGPPQAVESCTRLLMTEWGMNPSRIRYDRFG